MSRSPHREVNKTPKSLADSESVIAFSDPTNSKSVLVIPCLDEGERLVGLLRRIDELGLNKLVDILVVDGGSKLEPVDWDQLRSHRVSCGITYQGSSGLSGQLQAAYSFCLERGYEFILTIDGNNKDDPEGIPRIIEALSSGFDFVQGSRFLPGGAHSRTPLLRMIAVRLIHAPLLSWSSGAKWTDTTQGFRGYKAEMVGDERLDLFDRRFKNYSLLAYMSHRAPRLGFKVAEVGTRRIYPKGKVPTKISSLRGNWSILADLVRVVSGKYDAPSQHNDGKP